MNLIKKSNLNCSLSRSPQRIICLLLSLYLTSSAIVSKPNIVAGLTAALPFALKLLIPSVLLHLLLASQLHTLHCLEPTFSRIHFFLLTNIQICGPYTLTTLSITSLSSSFKLMILSDTVQLQNTLHMLFFPDYSVSLPKCTMIEQFE